MSADIVLAIGTSHVPLLNSPAEDYPKHAAIDASGRKRRICPLMAQSRHGTRAQRCPLLGVKPTSR